MKIKYEKLENDIKNFLYLYRCPLYHDEDKKRYCLYFRQHKEFPDPECKRECYPTNRKNCLNKNNYKKLIAVRKKILNIFNNFELLLKINTKDFILLKEVYKQKLFRLSCFISNLKGLDEDIKTIYNI